MTATIHPFPAPPPIRAIEPAWPASDLATASIARLDIAMRELKQSTARGPDAEAIRAVCDEFAVKLGKIVEGWV